MYQPILYRKIAITVLLSIIAAILFIQGASAYQGFDYTMVRATYFSGAAIVFGIAIIPWMTKE